MTTTERTEVRRELLRLIERLTGRAAGQADPRDEFVLRVAIDKLLDAADILKG